ncbi:hypothetical protein SAMN06269185_1090 [Natronoarchaeum philippinense]|uniref:Uncharacterized protein n=1 Tax=Natronoarchaeum philippinense TaxID=558529 RepID=A0A285N9S4_NATPI|nr:hypothetical protein SAMN06269185_1090 [Natronoarchaeum philippinense]
MERTFWDLNYGDPSGASLAIEFKSQTESFLLLCSTPPYRQFD